MKLKVSITGALLVLTIIVISVGSIGINVVSAYQGAAVACPNKYIHDQWPWDTPDEIEFSTHCCYYIYSYLDEHYDPGPVAIRYGDPIWYTQPPVTAQTYMDGLDYLEANADAATIVSKGHGTPWGYGGIYRKLLCTYGDAARDSIEIYPHTGQQPGQFKCRFNFIWHCGSANTYPYYPPWPPDGPPGLPFAFTHNVGMDKYGDYDNSGSRVFVGWNWVSPQFFNVIPDHAPWQWGQLAVAIFNYMHYDELSLRDTLENLSLDIYGTYFVDSPLYNDLIVWGNMDMTLDF
jgi:hypothetical protein